MTFKTLAAGGAIAAALILSSAAPAAAETQADCQIFRPTPHWLVEYAKCETAPLLGELPPPTR